MNEYPLLLPSETKNIDINATVNEGIIIGGDTRKNSISAGCWEVE
jgi:hypothetical protein